MRMNPRDLRRPICAAAILGALVCGCGRERNSATPPAPTGETNAPAPSALPALQPARLGRLDLLNAADQTASAMAAGLPYPVEVAALSGRDFTLSLPFGCSGPSASEAIRYSFDAETNTVRFTATPQAWTEAPWARAMISSPDVEAIEGFWVRRPWLRQEVCPVAPAPGQSAPETLGLAQVFEAAGSRVPRRGKRAYEATIRLRPGQDLRSTGLRLVLSGRLGSAPVRCRLEGAEAPPRCLILVAFDRVAFEDARGQVFAQWTG
jgi:hypothetical protein